MADYEVKKTPEFTTTARKLETTDRAHADLFNDLYQKLFDNDNYLKEDNDKKVNKKDGDITETQVSVIEESTESFPVPISGDKTKGLWGKLRKWQQDCLAKFGNYVLTSMITNQHLNDTNRVPSSALVYLMQQAVTQLNMDLEYKYKVLDSPYMDMSLICTGKEAVLYAANQVKVPMYEGYTYALCTLPISCPEYHIMVLVDNGSFGFLGIVDNVVTFEPYGRNFNVGDWIYIYQSLILY